MILQNNQSLDPSSLADIIREPILQLIDQIAGIRLRTLSDPRTIDGPSVRFSMKGDISGHIVFIFESSLSHILADRLLEKMGLETCPEYYLEALGELGNILMGHIDGKLDHLGINTTFSTPEVMGSKQDCLKCFSSMISVVFYSVDGAMEIALYMLQD